MVLQKINENKIKCTLSREELEDRDFSTSELEKRSDRMWALFREVISQAEEELGFNAGEAPLKIEVMLGVEEMTLFITKDASRNPGEQLADNIAALVNSISQQKQGGRSIKVEGPETKRQEPKKRAKRSGPATAVFAFDNIKDVIRGAECVRPVFTDKSVLYRKPQENLYYLCLTQAGEDAVAFAEVCLMLREFGWEKDAAESSIAYMEEHYEKVLAGSAVETLAGL